MPKPAHNVSLEEIRHEAVDEIRWLERVAVEHPSWDWPPELLVLAREFESLASSKSFDVEQIAEFTARLAAHISKKRLKGFDPMLWRAEALESLAREKKEAS